MSSKIEHENKKLNLEGHWIYRSYHNNPDPEQDDRWFIADLTLNQSSDVSLTGKLDSGDPS